MVKVSVCCCSLNAKFDTKIFIEALQHHNKGFDFEVVCTHDNRVEDGSAEEFQKITKKYPNVKFVESTEQDMLDYFSAALNYYTKAGMPADLISSMRERFNLYKSGQLIDRTKSMLWQSSGRLYNKAVEASSGEVIIVTPGDFMYLFPLENLYNYVNTQPALFYGKPTALWAKINNQPTDWILQHTKDVHDGKYVGGYRWSSPLPFRDYLRCPPKLSDLNLPDFRNQRILSLDSDIFMQQTDMYVRQSISNNEVQWLQQFHGFHVMRRELFNKIGGFSEQWIHRAFADDKMSYCGHRYSNGRGLPPWFAVAWVGQYELIPSRGCPDPYPSDWTETLKTVDPWYDKHPLPGGGAPSIYLHDQSNYVHVKMANLLSTVLHVRGTDVVRFK